MALTNVLQPRQPAAGGLPTCGPLQCNALSNVGELGNLFDLISRINAKHSSHSPHTTICFAVNCWPCCLKSVAAWVTAPLWLPSALPTIRRGPPTVHGLADTSLIEASA